MTYFVPEKGPGLCHLTNQKMTDSRGRNLFVIRGFPKKKQGEFTKTPRSQEKHWSQRAQRSNKFEISSEIENFEREWNFRASHRGPIFSGGGGGKGGKSRHRDWKFRARLKNSIEIESFERDWTFLIVGPSGILDSTRASAIFCLVYLEGFQWNSSFQEELTKKLTNLANFPPLALRIS